MVAHRWLRYTYIGITGNRPTIESTDSRLPMCIPCALHVSPILPGNTCRFAVVARVPRHTPAQCAGRTGVSCRGLINKWEFDLAGIIQELTSRPIGLSLSASLAATLVWPARRRTRDNARSCQYWQCAANVNNWSTAIPCSIWKLLSMKEGDRI